MVLIPSAEPTDESSVLRVVLADDSPADSQRTIAALQTEFPQLEIIQIASAAAWAEVLAAGAFELVVTEYRLNWTTGMALLRDTKARRPHAPVVMVTEISSIAAAVAAMQGGFDDYVPKNDLGRLTAAVWESLDRARRRIEGSAAVAEFSRSEERYRTLLELTSDYPFTLRVESNGTLVRERFGRDTPILGYAPEEFDARGGWANAMYPGDLPGVLELLDRLRANEQAQTDARFVTKSGEVRWFRLVARPVWDAAQQRVVRVHGAAQNVTEQKQAEAALQVSQARYRAVSELTSDFAYSLRVEPDGGLVFDWATGAFSAITGYTFEEMRGRDDWTSRLHPDDLPVALQHRERIFAGKPDVFEFRIVASDGSQRWLRNYARPVWDETSGRVVQVFGAAQDITERKEAEEQLRHSHVLLRAISEGTTDAVFVKDLRGQYLLINFAGAQVLGAPVDAVIGKDDTAFFSPDTAREIMTRDRRVMLAGETQTYEEVGTVAGTTRTYLSTKGPYRDPRGNVIGLFGISRDITERKRAEEALRESEARFRAVAETAKSAIFIQGETFRYANPATEAITGYSQAEILAMNFWDVLHPDFREQVRILPFAQPQDEPGVRHSEIKISTKSGEARWLDAAGAIVEIGGQPAVLGIAFDISERVRATEALQASEERYRELVENAEDIIFSIDPTGQITSINQAVEGITGYTRAEAMAMNFVSVIAPDQLAHAQEAFLRQLQGEKTPAFELDMIGKHGQRITFEVTSSTQYREGVPVAIDGIGRDITERRRGEAEKAALLEVARDISGTLDFSELLARVQRRTAQVLPCDAVITFSWNNAQQALRAISHCGLAPHSAADLDALTFGQPLFGDQERAAEAVVINDIHAQPWVPVEICERFHIAALIAAPLHMRDRQFGTLVAFSRSPGHTFSARQAELLDAIARQLAVAIEASELYEALEEEAAVSSALARVGQELIGSLDQGVLVDRLCRLTREVLGCDYSHAYLLHRNGEVFVPSGNAGDPVELWEAFRVLHLPRTHLANLLDRLDRDEVAQVVNDEPADLLLGERPSLFGVTATMFVPLRHGGQIFGLLSAGYRGRLLPFTEQQQRTARGVAQLASVALTNAHLVEELARANRLKSDFVATMSHELRTPLNIIMGYNDLLLDGAFGPLAPEQASRLRRADYSARQLLELINATLDLSRLESGQVPLDLHETGLGDLLAEVNNELYEVRQQKPSVQFVSHLAPGLPPLQTDPLKLKVVVKNVIANALKFTPRGQVRLEAHVRDGGVEINIADTGVGIAPESLGVIFEPFRQVDGSSTRRYGGVGLGLYVARRLVDMLGGTITVDSQVDRGSTFHIWVPTDTRSARQAETG
jgi:PAS domain S-box-containing protein